MTESSKFDFLRQRKNPKSQQSDISSTQNVETPAVQPAKKPGRPRGKRSNPDYIQVTSYIQRQTYKAVRRELLDSDREFSDLVEELLEDWLSRKG